MKNSSYEVEILVGGKAITEYDHEGTTWVEGRKGTEYEIRIKNHSLYRIMAVISVDSLNVLTGKPASSKDIGYIVQGFGNLTVPGFTLDNTEVAKFTFSKDKESSYVAQSGNNPNNVGIIGVKVFKEYQKPYQIKKSSYRDQDRWDDGLRNWNYKELVSNSCDYMAKGLASGYNNAAPRGFAPASATASSYSMDYSLCRSAEPVEEIGTAFGEAMEFKTTTVDFTPETNESATLIIRYGTRKMLEHVGIVFHKPKKSHAEPVAFPGDVGCRPPEGWRRKKNS